MTMINASFINKIIENKLMGLHTNYLAVVTSVDGNTATIEPLSLIKAVEGAPKRQAVIPNVPICKHISADIQEGSTVLVCCCERDITQTKSGIFALPSLRRHSLSDSVIIGVIEI